MMANVTLVALWTLESAGMLFWGAAAAIPLVMHFWNRHRYHETAWAAMDFLLASLRSNARRLRLEQWILLATRVLLLIAFAAALADPLASVPPSLVGAAGGEQGHSILVLDASYSMAFRHRDVTRFESAKAAMRDLVNESRDGEGFSLILMQNPPRVLVADPVRDRALVLREIDRAPISDGGADLHETLVEVERQIARRVADDPSNPRKRIYFFSDLGRTTWDDASQSPCRELLSLFSAQAELSLTDVGQDTGHNLALVNLRADKSLISTGEVVHVQADVKAYRTTQPLATRVQFLVDGLVIDEPALTVTAQGSATAVAEIRLHAAGDHIIEARLPNDSLDTDNQRWLIVPVRKAIQVLCIQGEPDAADFVSLALNPEPRADTPIRADVATESAILDRSTENVDCIVLNNVARISPDEAVVLWRFVEAGGGLVTVLGDRVQPENYNQQLGDLAKTQRVLPARLEQVVRDGERLFDPLEYKHPVVAAFRGHESAGLLTVPTWRYFRLKVTSPTARVALAFDNGDPAIVAERIGNGQSLLIATALSPSSVDPTSEGIVPWSALPTWPSFPPLVHGLVRAAIQGRETNRTVPVHSPLVITQAEAGTRSILVTLPDGSSQRTACSGVAGEVRCVFDRTESRGVYQIKSDSRPPTTQSFAVNIDPAESDLARVDQNGLPSELQSQTGQETTRNPAAAAAGVKLFRILLCAVAFLMVTEGALACWFARRAA